MSDDLLDYSRYPQVSGDLHRAVQERGLFDDAKTFVDAKLTAPPDVVLKRYRDRRDDPGFDLESFVGSHFDLPGQIDPGAAEPDGESLEDYVEALWSALVRRFEPDPDGGGTLLSMPNPHVVPGGRFREAYYWDSYFTAEGLAAAGRLDRVADLVENFANLIERFGFIPLGNRVYYDSRSQVPLFYRTLSILERERGVAAIEEYLPSLEREYEFWTAGVEDALPADGPVAHRRVVRTTDGTVLNRYWDDRATPRPESYDHDARLGDSVPEDRRQALYRDLRAACESGWDFSSRWLTDPGDLSTARTTDLAAVDLNAVLYGDEASLAEWYDATGESERARRYESLAATRRDAIDRYFWDEEAEWYVDYCWTDDEPSERLVLAGVAPLFTGAARPERTDAVARRLRESFLAEGGLLTTLHESGEQWDAPVGWAPLHWMAVVGLRQYNHHDLAAEVADRWLNLVESEFERTGRTAEKYDVRDCSLANGHGEYELQYDFGWTAGVSLALRSLPGADVGVAD
ncbi:trehalase [Halobacteriales archaeon QS_1_68_20]|nr:MAG: trehalase [Halobacteriales archaeon QS_1_68_20]